MRFLSKHQRHFLRTRTNTFKFVWKYKRSQIAKTISRKNRVGGIMLPDFKLYSKVTVIQMLQDCFKKQTQNKKPTNKPTYLWSVQEGKNIQQGKDSLFNTWCWELDSYMLKKKMTFTKINSKWIKDINVKPESTKLLEESRQNILT